MRISAYCSANSGADDFEKWRIILAPSKKERYILGLSSVGHTSLKPSIAAGSIFQASLYTSTSR
jgi:hypothetical protein